MKTIIISMFISMCLLSCVQNDESKKINSKELSILLKEELDFDSLEIICLEYPMPDNYSNKDNYLYYCKVEGLKKDLIDIQNKLKVRVDSFGIDHSERVAKSYFFEFIVEQKSQERYNWWNPCLTNKIYFSGFDRSEGILSKTDGTGIFAQLLCDDALYLFFGKRSNMLGAKE